MVFYKSWYAIVCIFMGKGNITKIQIWPINEIGVENIFAFIFVLGFCDVFSLIIFWFITKFLRINNEIYFKTRVRTQFVFRSRTNISARTANIKTTA